VIVMIRNNNGGEEIIFDLDTLEAEIIEKK
jgi:hypothetical protein